MAPPAADLATHCREVRDGTPRRDEVGALAWLAADVRVTHEPPDGNCEGPVGNGIELLLHHG